MLFKSSILDIDINEIKKFDNFAKDNIVLSTNKTYLLTKKNNHKIVLSEDDLLKIEERIKSQN